MTSMITKINTRITRWPNGTLLGDGLRAQLLRGGGWLAGAGVSEQAVRFGRNILLTRLLAPSAFGMMALALSASSLVNSITEIGAKEALIQNPRGEEERYLNTAWWLGLARGLSIYALCFALSPWISRFYGNSDLSSLIRVTFLSVLFSSLISPKAYVEMKQMRFAKWAVINTGGGICGVLITLLLAFVLRDVRALAIGYSAEAAARCILSYVLCLFVPKLKWHKEPARDLLQFSRGLFGLSLLNLLFSRADVIVLAKLYSPSDLGLYTIAIYLAQTPTSLAMNLLGQSLLPAFSRIRSDTRRANRILIKVSTLIVLVAFPALVFVFCYGDSVLTVLYGPRYAATAPSLLVATSVGLVNLLNGQITTIFFSRGVPQLHRRSVALMAAMMILAIYPFAKWIGPVGGQVAALLSVCIGYISQLIRVHCITDLKLCEYGKSVALPALTSILVLAIWAGTQPFDTVARPVANIALGLGGCALTYILAGALFFRSKRI